MNNARARLRHLCRLQNAFRTANYVTDGRNVYVFGVDAAATAVAENHSTLQVMLNDNDDDDDDAQAEEKEEENVVVIKPVHENNNNNDNDDDDDDNDNDDDEWNHYFPNSATRSVASVVEAPCWMRVSTLDEFVVRHARGRLTKQSVTLLARLFLRLVPVLKTLPAPMMRFSNFRGADGADASMMRNDESLQFAILKRQIDQLLLLNNTVEQCLNDEQREERSRHQRQQHQKQRRQQQEEEEDFEKLWALHDGVSLYVAFRVDIPSSSSYLVEQAKSLRINTVEEEQKERQGGGGEEEIHNIVEIASHDSLPCKWHRIGTVKEFVRFAFRKAFHDVVKKQQQQQQQQQQRNNDDDSDVHRSRICIAAEFYVYERVSFIGNRDCIALTTLP